MEGSGSGKNPTLSGKAEPGKPVTVKYQKFEILDDMIGEKAAGNAQNAKTSREHGLKQKITESAEKM